MPRLEFGARVSRLFGYSISLLANACSSRDLNL